MVWTLGRTWGRQLLEYILFIILRLLDNISGTGPQKDRFPVLYSNATQSVVHGSIASVSAGKLLKMHSWAYPESWSLGWDQVINMFSKWLLCTSTRNCVRLASLSSVDPALVSAETCEGTIAPRVRQSAEHGGWRRAGTRYLAKKWTWYGPHVPSAYPYTLLSSCCLLWVKLPHSNSYFEVLTSSTWESNCIWR